jgi:hypothetical protein
MRLILLAVFLAFSGDAMAEKYYPIHKIPTKRAVLPTDELEGQAQGGGESFRFDASTLIAQAPPGPPGPPAPVPTGTGFVHITSNVQDPTAKTVDLASADITGILPCANTPAFTGDVTKPQGTCVQTLATVNSDVGTFTAARVTVNGKGLVTAASTTNSFKPWDSSTIYVGGDVVIDRGGIWVAIDNNTNNQPVSGSAHWTLIGGTPYVDVVLGPADVYALFSVPVMYVPAPGPGKMIVPVCLVGHFVAGSITYATTDTGWFWLLGSTPYPNPGYPQVFNPGEAQYSINLGTDAVGTVESWAYPSFTPWPNSMPISVINQPLFITQTADNGPQTGVATWSIASGGSSYAIDDNLQLVVGTSATWVVTSVGGGGAITGLTLAGSGGGYSVGTFGTTTSGSGTGATISVDSVGDGNGTFYHRLFYRIVDIAGL